MPEEKGSQEEDIKKSSQEEQKGDEKSSEKKEEAKSQEEPKQKEVIPKFRFDKVLQKKDEIEKELEEYRAKEADANEKRLLEEKKYDEVISTYKETIDELKKKAERVERAEQALEGNYANLLEQVPEERRSLIPENLSIPDKMDYINRNWKLLIDTIKPKEANAGGEQPKSENAPTLDEIEKINNRMKEIKDKVRSGQPLSFQEKQEVSSLKIKKSQLLMEQS